MMAYSSNQIPVYITNILSCVIHGPLSVIPYYANGMNKVKIMHISVPLTNYQFIVMCNTMCSWEFMCVLQLCQLKTNSTIELFLRNWHDPDPQILNK